MAHKPHDKHIVQDKKGKSNGELYNSEVQNVNDPIFHSARHPITTRMLGKELLLEERIGGIGSAAPDWKWEMGWFSTLSHHFHKLCFGLCVPRQKVCENLKIHLHSPRNKKPGLNAHGHPQRFSRHATKHPETFSPSSSSRAAHAMLLGGCNGLGYRGLHCVGVVRGRLKRNFPATSKHHGISR